MTKKINASKPTKAKASKTKPAKTGSRKSGSAGKGSQRDRLEKELKGLISRIDEEGLIFLLKQAHVIVHNNEVDRINQEIDEYESKKPSTAKDSKKRKSDAVKAVKIEETNQGKSFFISLKKERKIFNLEEMRALVRICQAVVREGNDEIQAGIRLYRWFTQNRTDVLSDCGIQGNGDPYLVLLYNTIKNTYKVNK